MSFFGRLLMDIVKTNLVRNYILKRPKAPLLWMEKLDEADWHTADVADDWYTNYPVDSVSSSISKRKPVLHLTMSSSMHPLFAYDDETPDIVNSLRRDFNYDLNDNVGFALDLITIN